MKLFGYTISLNVLILIGILYLIMVVNALSGSCNREGLKGFKKIQNAIDSVNMDAPQSSLGTPSAENSYIEQANQVQQASGLEQLIQANNLAKHRSRSTEETALKLAANAQSAQYTANEAAAQANEAAAQAAASQSALDARLAIGVKRR